MNVLLIGAAGAAGVAIQKDLADHGHRVRCVDLGPPRYPIEELLDLFGYDRAIPDVEWVYRDVTEKGAAKEIVQNMDVCVYCALSVNFQANDPGGQFTVNLTAPYTLAQAGLEAGLDRFVYASTVSVNLDRGEGHKGVLTEETPLATTAAYAMTKWLAEQMLRSFARLTRLRAVCLRLGTLRPHYRFVMPALRDAYAQYFVDLRDVARAFRLAVENTAIQFDVLNIVSQGDPVICSPERAKAVLGFETHYNGQEHFSKLYHRQLEFMARHPD